MFEYVDFKRLSFLERRKLSSTTCFFSRASRKVRSRSEITSNIIIFVSSKVLTVSMSRSLHLFVSMFPVRIDDGDGRYFRAT